jgi:hypothetical protein
MGIEMLDDGTAEQKKGRADGTAGSGGLVGKMSWCGLSRSCCARQAVGPVCRGLPAVQGE